MQIIRITHDVFSQWSDQITELFNCSVLINFPDAEVDKNYGMNKCREVDSYLENGSAIVYAAIEGEKLAGWVWCHQIHRLDGLRIHIAEIAVAEEWHRHGIGSKLIEKVEQYASENGYQVVELLVTTSNLSAVNFYEKADFKPERYLMKKTIMNSKPAGEKINAECIFNDTKR